VDIKNHTQGVRVAALQKVSQRRQLNNPVKRETRPTTAQQADRFREIFSEDDITSKISMTGANGGKF
jgi:hypothetical protein